MLREPLRQIPFTCYWTWTDLGILPATSSKMPASIDTSVCDAQTRRMNVEADSLGENVVVVTVSADLPQAQKRWCGAAGIENVQVVSDVLNAEFGEQYGLLVKERRYLRRAVFIVDREGELVYVAYMPQIGQEPDYAEVIAAAKNAL